MSRKKLLLIALLCLLLGFICTFTFAKLNMWPPIDGAHHVVYWHTGGKPLVVSGCVHGGVDTTRGGHEIVLGTSSGNTNLNADGSGQFTAAMGERELDFLVVDGEKFEWPLGLVIEDGVEFCIWRK